MVRTAGRRTVGTGSRRSNVKKVVKPPVDDIPEEDADQEVAAAEEAVAEEEPVLNEAPKVEVVKMRFRLLHGVHEIVDGLDKQGRGIRKRFTTGDVLESDVDLTGSFPNRFERMTPEMEIREKVSEAKRRNPSPKVKAIVDKISEHAKAVGHASPRLRVIARGPASNNTYDVIREDNGLPINDKFLTLDEAKAMERAGNETAE